MKVVDGYLTIQQVAATFSISEMTVRRWIKADKMKAVQVLGTIRIAESEVERIKRGK